MSTGFWVSLVCMSVVLTLGLLALRRNNVTYIVAVDLVHRVHDCSQRDLVEAWRRSSALSYQAFHELLGSYDFEGRWRWLEKTWNYGAFMWRPRFWGISTVDGFLDKVGRPDWM